MSIRRIWRGQRHPGFAFPDAGFKWDNVATDGIGCTHELPFREVCSKTVTQDAGNHSILGPVSGPAVGMRGGAIP